MRIILKSNSKKRVACLLCGPDSLGSGYITARDGVVAGGGA